jgi:rubrerythrin
MLSEYRRLFKYRCKSKRDYIDRLKRWIDYEKESMQRFEELLKVATTPNLIEMAKRTIEDRKKKIEKIQEDIKEARAERII